MAIKQRRSTFGPLCMNGECSHLACIYGRGQYCASCFDLLRFKPTPVEPPAKYESKGTWFDPAEVAKRAGYLPTWDNLRITFGDISFPAQPYMVNGKPTCPCGALATFSGRCNFHQKADKPMTQPNQTKVSIPAAPWCPPTIAPVAVQITTPAGATINAEEAALSVDALGAIARDFTPIAPSCVSHATRIRMRLSELHGICDTHRRERDEARAQRRAALRDANAAATIGAAYLRERDEARAEVAALKRELRAVGEQSEPATRPFLGIPAGTLDHLRYVLARELPLTLSSEVRAERVDGIPLGTIKIVIQEGTGNPTPAVTKDTVVTLGMLRGLVGRGQEIRNEAGEPSWVDRRSPMQQAIDEKLAGK